MALNSKVKLTIPYFKTKLIKPFDDLIVPQQVAFLNEACGLIKSFSQSRPLKTGGIYWVYRFF